MDIRKTLFEALGNAAHGWSMGSFGAIAEFHMDPGEPTVVNRPGVVATERGAIRVDAPDAIRPVAYETLSPRAHRWVQSVALCLPEAEAGMSRRTVLTCLGPDDGAIRPRHRKDLLFDMGLGQAQVDFCVRTSDPDLVAVLHGQEGQSLFAPGNPAMSVILAAHPHRVALTRVGRVEVYQKIGGPDTGGVSPPGPHTHVLPRLLASGRTHSANVPIPAGLVPCGGFHPESPVIGPLGEDRDFDAVAFSAFQQLLTNWGMPDYLAVKKDVWSALAVGRLPDEFRPPDSRQGRAALRNALRQQRRIGGETELLRRWIAHFDAQAETDEPPETEPLQQGH